MYETYARTPFFFDYFLTNIYCIWMLTENCCLVLCWKPKMLKSNWYFYLIWIDFVDILLWFLTVCVKSSRFVTAIFSHGRLRVRDTCEWSGDAIQIQIPGRSVSQTTVSLSYSYKKKKACSDKNTHIHRQPLSLTPAKLHTQTQREFPFCFVLVFAAASAALVLVCIACNLSFTHTRTHTYPCNDVVVDVVCVLFVVFAHAARQRSYSASNHPDSVAADVL